MGDIDKLSILAKSKKKSKRGSALKLLKRNAVPKKSGGRKDAPKKGGGTKAALMRKIHKDPDIQRLLKKNPRYDIIVVKKVQASVFARAMVKSSEQEGLEFDKSKWWEVAQRVNPDYTKETFDRDWEQFQTMKQSRDLSGVKKL